MALRKHQRTSEQKAVHTGDGHVIRRGLGAMLPPPDDGYLYLASGSYWVGPFYQTQTMVNGNPTNRTIRWGQPARDLDTYDMFEGME